MARATQVAPISTSKGPGIDCDPHMFFYPESEAEVGVVQYSTVAGASKQLTKMVAAAAAAAIKERGSFAIALTGSIRTLGFACGSQASSRWERKWRSTEIDAISEYVSFHLILLD